MVGYSDGRADEYFGIVIQQSLRDGKISDPATVLATKTVGTWVFLLVRVPAAHLDGHIRTLQANMVSDAVWYAHYFRENYLTVVFRDKVFKVSLDKSTWRPVIEYGLARNIPAEQLDFKPNTRDAVLKFFDL